MVHFKILLQAVFRFSLIGVSLITANFSAEGQCPNPVTPCNPPHQTTIDLATVPQCGTSTVSIQGDIQGSQPDCLGTANADWKCHQFTITRPVGSLTQQFTLKIGQGAGCTGELDATYGIINGVCTQLSNGGSGTNITFSFPIGVNSMVLDLCLNSSAFVTICNLCVEPPPCTMLPQCNLANISVSGCKADVPVAATSPANVFTNIGTCSAMLQMTHTDVGDTSFCMPPAGVNFVRTYNLSFFDGTQYVPYRTCSQTIIVTSSTGGVPVISACAVTRNIEGCNTGVITDPPYSTTTAASTEAVFEDATNQGNTSNSCGSGITYIDIATGTCPIVVTRKWTVSDDCGHSATCNQTINVNVPAPTIYVCAVTRNIEGCNVSSITNPAYSETMTASTEAVFESAPNLGNVSDACGITSVTYIDMTTGTCPKVVTRKWTVSDACGHSATCNQTINVIDTGNPVIVCPDDLVLTCDPAANNIALIMAWLATATATDACDGDVMITYSYDGISIPQFTCEGLVGGGLHILFTATDDCGNTATCNATVSKPCFDIDAKIYIEGASIDPNGSITYTLPMRTTLNDVRVLPGQTLLDPFVGTKYTPPGQPFSGPPWNYPGTEGSLFDSGGNPAMGDAGYPPTVVDWVLVSLRSDSAGTGGLVCQTAALLHNDGHIQFLKPLDCCDVNENTDYYIVVEHRDHLIVMSDIKVSFFSHKLLFDFRANQGYLDDPFNLGIFARQKEIMPGTFAMFTGDGEQSLNPLSDTNINADDRSTWINQNGQVGQYRLGDYNMNGDTNLNDRVVWERNNPRFTSVPRD